MPRHGWLICALLLGCAGTAEREPGPHPDLSPFAPSGPDGGGLPEGAPCDTVAPDAGLVGDSGASVPGDGASCPTIAPGAFAADLAGQATGTLTFKLVQGTGGLGVSKGTFKITQPKAATYPLTLGSVDCGELHAAIARPEGSTGGTDLRGSIAAHYKAAQKIFVGTWTMPFGTGTFKARPKP